MKKITLTICTLLTFIFIFSLTACSIYNTSQQKESLEESQINEENLEFFKRIFIKSGDLMYEDYSLEITIPEEEFAITLYCTDATGKVITTYDVQGDIYNDILDNVVNNKNTISEISYDYSFEITERKNNNIITGTHFKID